MSSGVGAVGLQTENEGASQEFILKVVDFMVDYLWTVQ